MRKVYIVLTVLATVFAASCSKTDDKKDGKKFPPEIEPEQEYDAPIKIDGDFSDWAVIDDSKMCIATCANETAYKALKVMKVFMDEMYMFVYLKFDNSLLPDRSVVQAHAYFDADNDEATGGCNNQWEPGCIEYMCEGKIISADTIVSFDPSLSSWIGKPLVGGWEWESILSSGSGLFTGDGKVDEYEMSMLRASIADLGDVFGFGFDIQQNWSSVGILPNADVTDENPTGKANLMKVSVK